MKERIRKAVQWMAHRKKTTALGVLILAGGIYWLTAGGSSEGETRRMYAEARKGTVELLVTGSGQVEAFDRVDVTSEVSGDVEAVYVKAGDAVRKDDALAFIDDEDAKRDVTNAELAVANAEIAYKNAQKQFADQAEDSSVSDIRLAHESGYRAIADSFIDFPTIFLEVGKMFYDPEHSPYFSDFQVKVYANSLAIEYKTQAGLLFDKAKKDYETYYSRYKSISVNSDPEEIESFLDVTYTLLKDLSAALNATYSAIDYVNERRVATEGQSEAPTEVAADKSKLGTYLNTINSRISAVSNATTAIDTAKDSSTEAEVALKSAELSLSKAQDDLRNAKEALANHTVRAPFDGVAAKISVKAGDKASVNSDIATVITDQKIVTISLNEVDAAKVKVGQKATVTFDAVDDLSVEGEITEVDLLGTVSQGVVSYSMQIAFDVDDERIKPGMTTNASIVVDSRQGVVAVSSGAIKSDGKVSYVEIEDPDGTVRRAVVETGLSGDDLTEILSGLSEGDRYVVRTVTVSGQSAAQTTNSAASLLGGSRAAGGTGVRTGTGQGQVFITPK